MSATVTGQQPTGNVPVVTDGAAQSITDYPVLLLYIAIGMDATENEFLHLFDQALPPVLGDLPLFSLGRLKRDVRGRNIYTFNPPGGVWIGSTAASGLKAGISITNTTFTPSLTPADYVITYGLEQFP